MIEREFSLAAIVAKATRNALTHKVEYVVLEFPEVEMYPYECRARYPVEYPLSKVVAYIRADGILTFHA